MFDHPVNLGTQSPRVPIKLQKPSTIAARSIPGRFFAIITTAYSVGNPRIPPMDAFAFVEKWRRSTRTEPSTPKEHFLDLCELGQRRKPDERDSAGFPLTVQRHVLAACACNDAPLITTT